jgi:hypothetical protein
MKAPSTVEKATRRERPRERSMPPVDDDEELPTRDHRDTRRGDEDVLSWCMKIR